MDERRSIRQVHDQAFEPSAGQTAVVDEHFSVDGTLIEAWASQKSFRPKDGSGDDDGGAKATAARNRAGR